MFVEAVAKWHAWRAGWGGRGDRDFERKGTQQETTFLKNEQTLNDYVKLQ